MNTAQPSALRHSQFHYFSKLPVALLCGLLMVGTATSAQAASSRAQAAGGSVPLTLYNDKNVSFLYPKSWAKQVIAGRDSTIIFASDDATLKAAMASSTPTLTKDQFVVEVIAGRDAVSEISSVKASGTALDVLKAISKAASSSTTTYGTPEALNLISSTDAAQVSIKDTVAKDDGVVIALSPNDHPVFVAGLVAQNQLASKLTLIQGIASTMQPNALASAATASASSPAADLSETFTNKIYTLKYPKGWLTASTTNNPEAVYLATDQSLLDAANSGKFSLTSGQILVGLISGQQLSSLVGGSSLATADMIAKLTPIFVDGSNAIFTNIGPSTPITIGTLSADEAPLTLKSGGSGYVIAFYTNKKPVLLLGMTADGEAEANRSTFEQIAASLTFNTP